MAGKISKKNLILKKYRNFIAIFVLFIIVVTSSLLLSNTTLNHKDKAANLPMGNTTLVNTPGYSVVKGTIYKNGSVVTLHGVNWSGFETDWHVFHGVDRRNYGAFMDQMKSIGINAVRVPVCPDTIKGTPTLYINYSQNSDLQNLNSIQVLDKMMSAFQTKGIYVLLDFHRPDCYSQSSLWYTSTYTESQWISDLLTLANRYKSNEYFLGMDLKNEPNNNATWGTGNLSTDWNKAAEKAGAQVLAANPNILVFIQGIQENPICSDGTYAHFWGENFEPFDCTPIDSNQIPYYKMVLTPHVYGPDVFIQNYFDFSSQTNFENKIFPIWDKHFGNLNSRYFSVIPGEWGGKYGTDGGNPNDVIWQNGWVDYLISRNMCSSFYWSWNGEPSDVDGLLQGDWTTLYPTKVTLIQKYFNQCIRPSSQPSTTPSSTIVPTSTVALTPVPTASPLPTNSPSPTPTKTLVPTTIASNGTCSVSDEFDSLWGNGYTSRVRINNNTGVDINGWTLTFTLPTGQSIVQLWNGTYTVSGLNITVKNDATNNYLNNGNFVEFVFNGSYSGNIAKPASFTLNNILCKNTSTTIISSTPTATTTIAPLACSCSQDICSNSCTFNKINNVSYSANISCSRENVVGITLTPADKDSYCNRPNRTLGDADGDGQVNALDYIYYVRVVNGGLVPSKINADFNGDGVVSVSDRSIILQSLPK